MARTKKRKTKSQRRKTKSRSASMVLQLLDQGWGYEKALKFVLRNNKRIKKKNLEKELDIYI